MLLRKGVISKDIHDLWNNLGVSPGLGEVFLALVQATPSLPLHPFSAVSPFDEAALMRHGKQALFFFFFFL